MTFKYYLGAVISLPILPIMYFHGKRIKATVPDLPEAKKPFGIAGNHKKSKLKLLCIGESTVAGVGVETHDEGFAGTLAKHLAEGLDRQVHWKVYARSGYTAEKVEKRLLPKIAETEADLIVVGMGGNNAFGLHSPARWLDEIQSLIDALRIKFPDTPIAFTNMPPIKEFPAFTRLIKFTVGNLVEIFGQSLEKQIKGQKGIYYNQEIITLDTWTRRLNLKADISHYFSDGVHPSKFTYQVWAKDFADFILNRVEGVKKYQ